MTYADQKYPHDSEPDEEIAPALTRRTFLQRSMFGVTAVGLTGFLAACGDDEDDEDSDENGEDEEDSDEDNPSGIEDIDEGQNEEGPAGDADMDGGDDAEDAVAPAG